MFKYIFWFLLFFNGGFLTGGGGGEATAPPLATAMACGQLKCCVQELSFWLSGLPWVLAIQACIWIQTCTHTCSFIGWLVIEVTSLPSVLYGIAPRHYMYLPHCLQLLLCIKSHLLRRFMVVVTCVVPMISTVVLFFHSFATFLTMPQVLFRIILSWLVCFQLPKIWIVECSFYLSHKW